MSLRVSAPGKLVLLGEYAVLDGAPALALAVAHGVICTVTKGPFGIDTPDGDTRFVREALASVGAPNAHYRFSHQAPFDLPGKPGMGGSGAAVVAAMLAGGFVGTPQQLTARAIGVHRAVQGSGSGIDIATSAHGGAILFEGGECRAVEVPTPVVIWAGNSASTGPRVERYQDHPGRDAFVEASRKLVQAFSADPIHTIQEAWRRLCEMADQAGILYRTPTIDAIVAEVERHGGAAKPSGAGGGDAVVAWGPPDLASRLRYAGFTILPIQPAGPPTLDSIDG